MKDEIKEILDSIQEHLKEKEENFKKGAVDSTVYYLYCDDARALLNYITNLQEETERQSKAQVILDNQIAEMLKYKERNEKVIEKIKKIQENAIKYGADHDAIICQDLLNILQGEDNTPENLYKYTPEKGFRLVGDEE